jgi:hypothetical protein
MADKYPGISPYVYCNNNPISLIDPDGNESILSDGLLTFTLPTVTITAPGVDVIYVFPMPSREDNLRMVSAGQFLAKEMQKLKLTFLGTVAVGLDKISHLWNEDSEGDKNSDQDKSQGVDQGAPDPDKIYVDKAGNEYRFKPRKNWNGKKDRDGNYPSRDGTKWGPVQNHKGFGHKLPHRDVQLPNRTHVNVILKK